VASQDARSETDILLSFRTSQSTALLLLAAGTNDFCAVMLDSGAVRVRIDLGSGEASVSTRPGYVFNDLQWHSVRLRRIQATLNLIVDGMLTNAVTPGNFFEVCKVEIWLNGKVLVLINEATLRLTRLVLILVVLVEVLVLLVGNDAHENKPMGSVVSNRIWMKFGRSVLQVNKYASMDGVQISDMRS